MDEAETLANVVDDKSRSALEYALETANRLRAEAEAKAAEEKTKEHANALEQKRLNALMRYILSQFSGVAGISLTTQNKLVRGKTILADMLLTYEEEHYELGSKHKTPSRWLIDAQVYFGKKFSAVQSADKAYLEQKFGEAMGLHLASWKPNTRKKKKHERA